ncbi:hypothetical protein ACFXPQ_20350 [Streptomyces lydicus]|uniref:WXG100 family type VII secretion target n=1 Tax=Streptomyces lydicus TaxID=47763 RepID=UPI0036A3A126
MTESSNSYNSGTGNDGSGYTYEATPAGYGVSDGLLGAATEGVPGSYSNAYGNGSYGLDPGSYGGGSGWGGYAGYPPGNTVPGGLDGSTGNPADAYGTDPNGYNTGYNTGYDTGYDTGGYGLGGYGIDPTGGGGGYDTGNYGSSPNSYGSGWSGPGSDTNSDSSSSSDSKSDSSPDSSSHSDSNSDSSSKSSGSSDSANGDYSKYTWKQVMEAVTGSKPDDPGVNGSDTSDPQSLQNAADTFWYAGQVLKEADENLSHQINALVGENGSWKGPAAQSFYKLMQNVSQQVSNLTDVLTGGITGDYNVPQQLANNAQHLREAIAKLHDIDVWYANQAIEYYNEHPGEFKDDIVMDDGRIAVSQVKSIPPLLDSDMRQVLIALAAHYKVTGDSVPHATFSSPITGGGRGLPDSFSSGVTGLGTPLQQQRATPMTRSMSRPVMPMSRDTMSPVTGMPPSEYLSRPAPIDSSTGRSQSEGLQPEMMLRPRTVPAGDARQRSEPEELQPEMMLRPRTVPAGDARQRSEPEGLQPEMMLRPRTVPAGDVPQRSEPEELQPEMMLRPRTVPAEDARQQSQPVELQPAVMGRLSTVPSGDTTPQNTGQAAGLPGF